MTAGALPATVDILRELRDAGVRLIGLTNWPAETFAPARERFEFFSWFEGIVVSGEVGVAKPDEAIFTLLLDRYDVDPATAVYVDDTLVHVETARRLGLTGFVFSDAVTLRRDFAGVGLPVRCGRRRAGRPNARRPRRDHRHLQPLRGATRSRPSTLAPFTRRSGARWFDQYSEPGPYRLLVATRDGDVIGYAAASSQFRAKPAYDHRSRSPSTWLPTTAGAGVGSLLYQQLFARLRARTLHRAYAPIALPNPASVALHRRFAFPTSARCTRSVASTDSGGTCSGWSARCPECRDAPCRRACRLR